MTTQTWTYETSPVAWDYKLDRSFASFIIGPVGSGKSVPSLQRIFDLGQEQAPSDDGIKRSRFAVIRNTLPELRSTTAVTYGQIYPEEFFGSIIWRSPATHILAPRGSGVEIEVNLIALDKPRDVKKLLSLELTGAFINEIREVPRSVVTRLTERVGRFGVNDRPTTWSGIWGDTNPPDADHWLYDWHHKQRPAGFAFHQQPPGVLQVQPMGKGAVIADDNFPEYKGIKLTSAEVLIWWRGKVQRVECPIEVIQAADRHWIVNPWMENLVALSRVDAGSNPIGARSYYGRALAGKTLEEIQSYLQGVYTFVTDGRRVIPQYNGTVHGVDHIPVLPDAPILIGADIGGGTLQPSALLFQRHPKGMYLAHREVVCFDMGIKRFGELVSEALRQHFPEHAARGLVGKGWGDPAGGKRDEIFETASFDYLREHFGINLEPAPSQDPRMRIAALSGPCERLVEGKPGLLVNKRNCPMLHKGLMGAWHFKRVQVTGEVRYMDTPSKNDESHICDGAGYGFLGAGEFHHVGGRDRDDKARLPAIAEHSWDVFKD
jgi:hypothetical protein